MVHFGFPWPVKSALACGTSSLLQQAAYLTGQRFCLPPTDAKNACQNRAGVGNYHCEDIDGR